MTTTELLDRILVQLGGVRAQCPELRFGQLIATIGELAQDETGHSLWDVEDADFAVALKRFAEDLARRGSAAASDCLGVKVSPESTAPGPPRQVS